LQTISVYKQFAVTEESPDAILALPQFDVCSIDNVLSTSDNSSHPGDVPNSWNVEKGESYNLSGFALDKARGSVPKAIRLLLVGKRVYSITLETGLERPDVAQYFTQDSFRRSGYSSEVRFDDVPPGDYKVVVTKTQGNRTLVCRTFQTITVR
jgi:hypothetical protein